jgi:predicted transposase/invertase (TIGR01784 family)
VVRDFLHHYLPMEIADLIDIDTIEPQKDSFVDAELRESFTDLLFEATINDREGYLYFLFEHKSYLSRDIVLQLLKYMAEIWAAKMKKEGSWLLPAIIPLVVYHGQKEWKIKSNLSQMILGYEQLPLAVRDCIPDYKYLLYDLGQYGADDIKGEAMLRAAFTMFKNIDAEGSARLIEAFMRATRYLQELEDEGTRREYFETLIVYVYNAGKNLTEPDIDKLIKKVGTIYPEGSEAAMTIAEMLREAGMEKGIEQGLRKVIINSIRKGLPLKDIAEITGLEKEEVAKVAQGLNG